MKYWIGRNARQLREFRLITPVMSRSATSESGFGNFWFAVTGLCLRRNITVYLSYRILNWLWSIQYPVHKGLLRHDVQNMCKHVHKGCTRRCKGPNDV